MSTRQFVSAGADSDNALAGTRFKVTGDPLETVQLYLRHPHFDSDNYVLMDEEEDAE